MPQASPVHYNRYGARVLRSVAWLVGCLGAFAACASAADRPTVVLVGLGALRADVAERDDVAPTLQLLARRGVHFTAAYSNVPWPRGAAATVLSGALSHRHGVHSPLDPLAPDVTLLSERARDQGYDTVAVVSHFDLDPVFGFGRGFLSFDARLPLPIVGNHLSPLPVPSLFFGDLGRDRSLRGAKLQSNARRPDDWTAEAALATLSKYRGRDLFLWVSFFGPSQTWIDDELHFRSRADYEARVRFLDEQLARLARGIDALRQARDALIILYGDSGFALLEHSDYGAGNSLYEPSVRVPLVVVWLGKVPQGRVVTEPVSLLDLAPTLADLLGWGNEPQWRGHSLRPWLTEEGDAPKPRTVFLETSLPATLAASREVRDEQGRARRIGIRLQAVRAGRYKLIRREAHPLIDVPHPDPVPAGAQRTSDSWELYDLLSDPAEQHNVAASAPHVLEDLTRKLREWNPSGRGPSE